MSHGAILAFGEWFVEDSTPVLVWGLIFEVVLIFALVKSGRLWLLYAMAGLALVVGGIVWHEKHTITDAKQIRAYALRRCGGHRAKQPAGRSDIHFSDGPRADPPG